MLHSVLLVEVYRLVCLGCPAARRARLCVHGHVVLDESYSVSKHFVCDVLVEVDVDFPNRLAEVSLL